MPEPSTQSRNVLPAFQPLWSDIERDTQYFREHRPLLAHYSSVAVLEQIVKNNEIWFGNPLFMNDIEEVWVGIREGVEHFKFDDALMEVWGKVDMAAFRVAFDEEERAFADRQAFDTYILCLSEHDPDDGDGLLSMWRGYGDFGRGAAIVFDGGYLSEQQNTPLIISKVAYATRDQRAAWYGATGERMASVLRQHTIKGQTEVKAAAKALFARLRMFALYTKHKGFSEEREWRMAYMPERDPNGVFRKYFSYHNGPRGVEPKLKMKIEPVPEFGNEPISLQALVHSIILGPTLSTPLAVTSTQRMLESLGRPELSQRVKASRIPYRPL